MSAMRDENPEGSPAEEAPPPPPNPPPRLGPMARLRNYFFAGVLVTAPVSITFYLAWLFISFVDAKVTPLIPARYHPELWNVPGIGLLIVFVTLTLIGFVTAGWLGRMLIRSGERLLSGMPVIRSVYSATKQIFETVLAQKSTAFREVALIEYPRKGIWTLGFLSGSTSGEVQHATSEELVNVFIPTTPNPTSGFLLFVPRKDIKVLDMSIEEGIKMVVSGGIVTPPWPRPKAPVAPEPAAVGEKIPAE